MDRATKLFVVGWACAALGAQLWLLRGGWPSIAWLGFGCFAAAGLATALDRRSVAAVLVCAYVFPALVALLHGQYHVYFGVLWVAALLGAMVPDAARSGWQVPARWRAAIGCWALLIVAGATVVIWREMDFYPGLVFREDAAGPRFAAQWVLHLSLCALAGILWFDWLFGAADLDRITWVAVPLALSCAILAAVAIYQATVDISFLNRTVYGVVGRASGTVFDGNVCGVLAAFWIGGATLLADSRRRSGRLVIGAAMAVAWTAVWATGSRTGFVAAAISTAFSVVGLARSGARDRPPRVRLAYAAGALAVLVAAGLVAANLHLTVSGPIPRLLEMAPELSFGSVAAFVSELWNRNRYGEMATVLIRRFPWFGIGIGSFNSYASETAFMTAGIVLPPDNAQNWYRHQLVEFGLVGSIAWLVWVATFGRALFRRRPGEGLERRAIRGSLVAFGFVSLFGVPGQDLTVFITFWTFAFWYLWPAPEELPPRRVKSRVWVAGIVAAVVFAAGTYHTGVTRLRPPFRARDRGLPYGYGLNPVETDGSGGEQRWTRGRAVAVIAARTRQLELTVSVNHLDLATRPVHAKVWCDGRLVVDTYLRTSAPLTSHIQLARAPAWTVIDTWVDRTLNPSDFGLDDDRQLGLLVRWRFND
ncbi:MAG: hypothetical protein GEU82_11355 [Luteitalea sp.]|nr:hypothetical protein [Luteitalea sp.]